MLEIAAKRRIKSQLCQENHINFLLTYLLVIVLYSEYFIVEYVE